MTWLAMILSRPQSRVRNTWQRNPRHAKHRQPSPLRLKEFVSTPYDYTMGAMLKNAPRGFYKADIQLKVDNAFRRFDESHQVVEIDA